MANPNVSNQPVRVTPMPQRLSNSRKTAPSAVVKRPLVAPAQPVAPKPSVFAAQWVRVVASILLLAVVAIPVGIYYRTVYENAVNVPFQDDFDSVFHFLAEYVTATPAEKLKLIFSQHNEHRIVLDRLFFIGQYAWLGHTDLRGGILFGNLALLAIAGLLFVSTFRGQHLPTKLLYLLPVAWIVFQFHFWELTVWAMASIQNLYVVAFALLSLYALNRSQARPRWFHVAYIAAAAAVFTSGNGMFTFFAGLPVLLLQKRYRQAGVWTVVGAALVALYFWGYAQSTAAVSVYNVLVENPGRSLDYFFTLTGSLFSAEYAYPIRAGKIFLLLSVGLCAYLVITKRLTGHLTLVSFLVFLYLTSLALILSRSSYGVQQALSPRYGIISVLIFSSVVILALEAVGHRYLKWVTFGLALGVSVYSYVSTYDLNRFKIEDRTRQLRLSAALYNDNSQNLILYYPDQALAKTNFTNAVARNIYRMPGISLDQLRSRPVSFGPSSLTATNDVTADARPFQSNRFIVFHQAYALQNGVASDKVKTRVIAQSADAAYAFDTGGHVRYDVVNQLQTVAYLKSGFSCVIDRRDLKPGRYALWLHLTNGDNDSFLPLNVTFDA